MDEFLKDMLMNAMKDENAGAKALASYMFRDLVDDIHSEGKISEEEMEHLNREACNRAALFWNHIMMNKDMRTAFLIEAVNVTGWDPPVMTDDMKKRLELYRDMASEIRFMREQYKQMKKDMKEERK